MPVRSLWKDLEPGAGGGERFDALLERRGLRLERIVSRGHATPAGEWYDQDLDEWVLVLRGRAGLRLADRPELVVLEPGDHLLIPARRRHRVEWTDATGPTVWLALHCPAGDGARRSADPP